MGDPSAPERPSLDRLKNLGDLPDLDAQLQEASQLCNHAARADMILRWLLGKLKADEDARRSPDAWRLLCSCVRLLSSQRIATLLGPAGFTNVLNTTFADLGLLENTLVETSSAVELLLAFAQRVDGAAITSVLSFQSEIAASVCGNWLQRVYDCWVDSHEGSESHPEQRLLSPALHLWSLRKRSQYDDELFSTNCLLPASMLLVLFREQPSNTSNKRKRSENTSIQCSRSLETLIAKHTILPARTIFYKSQSNSTRKPRNRNTSTPQPGIKERLGPLKMAILRPTSQHALRALPVILDIALRSVPMPTPKHRFDERPWVQTLFDAIRGCFASSNRSCCNETLGAMLEIIQRRGLALPIQILAEIVRNDAFSSHTDSLVDWLLITKVVKLDTSVFTDTALVEQIFNAVTQQQRTSQSNGDEETTAQASMPMLKNEVILPIMKTFAQSRNLGAFLDAWHKQLLSQHSLDTHCLWRDIGAATSDILEEALSNDKILNRFDNLLPPLEEWASDEDASDEDEECKRIASLVQLCVIVRGSRTEELLTKVYSRVDALLRSLFAVRPKKAHIAVLRQTWGFLASAFEVWFPRWASQQSHSAVADMGSSLLTSKPFKSAQKHCGVVDQQTSHTAQVFVTTLCYYFLPYESSEMSSSLVAMPVEKLSQLKDSTAIDVFLKFPALLTSLQTELRRKLFSGILTSGRRESLNQESIGAVMAIAQSIGDLSLLNDVVSVASEHLVNIGDQDMPDHELALLRLLVSIDPTTIPQEQQQRVLDAIFNLGPVTKGQSGSAQIQCRLSLLLSLLPSAQQEATLLQGASKIWSLVALFENEARQDIGVEETDELLTESENLNLLERITSNILQAWLATKDQQRSQDILTQLSKRVKEYIRKGAKQNDLTNRRALLVAIKTTTILLEKHVRGDLADKLYTQDKKTIQLYLDTLTKELEAHWLDFSHNVTSNEKSARLLGYLQTATDALLSLPDSVRALITCEDSDQRVLNVARRTFVEPDSSPSQYAHIRPACFRLACKYGGDNLAALTELAEYTLQYDLSPKEYMNVLQTYTNVLQSTDVDSKASVLELLASKLQESPIALLLHQEVLMVTSKEDLDHISTLSEYHRLSAPDIIQQILHAISSGTTLHVRRAALHSLATILTKRPSMLTQHTIEQTLTTLHHLQTTSPHAPALYTPTCQILTHLFATQRARLTGRFHLLVALFQALTTTLFHTPKPNDSSPRHARALARLLESFCSPPRARAARGKSSDLVDQARKAQARAGQYAQYILHHYCGQILTGALGEGVREALMPGLWAMIEAIEVNNAEGIKVLSASMNNSERAVLRSVYDDWKRFGKWEGL